MTAFFGPAPDKEGKYQVEEIVDESDTEYLVKWTGYSEMTWQDKKIMSEDVPELVHEFQTRSVAGRKAITTVAPNSLFLSGLKGDKKAHELCTIFRPRRRLKGHSNTIPKKFGSFSTVTRTKGGLVDNSLFLSGLKGDKKAHELCAIFRPRRRLKGRGNTIPKKYKGRSNQEARV